MGWHDRTSGPEDTKAGIKSPEITSSIHPYDNKFNHHLLQYADPNAKESQRPFLQTHIDKTDLKHYSPTSQSPAIFCNISETIIGHFHPHRIQPLPSNPLTIFPSHSIHFFFDACTTSMILSTTLGSDSCHPFVSTFPLPCPETSIHHLPLTCLPMNLPLQTRSSSKSVA